jgi:hypothetical protein
VPTSDKDIYVRFEVEAVLQVRDPEAVKRAALDAVEVWTFTGGDGQHPEQSAEDARAAIRESLVEALHAVVDPERMINAAGSVQLQPSAIDIRLCDRNGLVRATPPDFADLFPLCRCGEVTCASCSSWQMSPRMAGVLWSVGQVLADRAYDDVESHGDDPVTENNWCLFHEYPSITWGQDALWRRQAARAFDDLAGDVAAGQWPIPRCAGEEMALRLMLAEAADLDTEEQPGDRIMNLRPEHPDDTNWDLADDVLFQDHDLSNLYAPDLDGIEDPDSDLNQEMGIGDYRPAAWFRWFHNVDPRDGRRPFRR